MATVPTSSSPEKPSTTRTTKSSGVGARLQTKVPAVNANASAVGVGIPWQTGNANWDISQDNTGFAPPVAQGYDATAATLNAKRKANAMARANGFLVTRNKGPQMPMFVLATNIDTSIGGSSAQSQLVQDWYPRNFVQPVINVYGVSLDQEDYGTLCEFVHNSQFDAVSSPSWPVSMTQLVVLGSSGWDSLPGMVRKEIVGASSGGRGVQSQFTQVGPNGGPQNQSHVNQIVRGDHDAIIAKGYINSMPRIHQQFTYSTLWQFDFTVAQMLEGPFRETAGVPRNLPNTNGMGPAMWVDMVTNSQTIGLSTVSSAQNKASLAYAASNAATIANSATS